MIRVSTRWQDRRDLLPLIASPGRHAAQSATKPDRVGPLTGQTATGSRRQVASSRSTAPPGRSRSMRALELLAVLFVMLAPAVSWAQEPDAFTRALERGPIYAGGAAFLGGLLTSLTPCVYPMIAITVSVFGARQAKSRREAMLLSTCFVMGIVVLFTGMLVAVAMAGGMFGSALQSKCCLLYTSPSPRDS